jgi:hypothetical protein
MKTSLKPSVSLSFFVAGAFALVGCAGSSSSNDASGDTGSAGSGTAGAGGDSDGGAGSTGDATTGDATGDATGDGPTLYRLSGGDSCFEIVSADPGASDGCGLNVDKPATMDGLVGTSLPFNYDGTTAIVTLGTTGSLGKGQVTFNMGTLNRDGDTSDPNMATCTWHQKDTSMVTLTADNELTVSITEIESMFAAAPACTAATIPTGGTCTSTWTWKMKKSTTKTPPTCK